MYNIILSVHFSLLAFSHYFPCQTMGFCSCVFSLVVVYYYLLLLPPCTFVGGSAVVLLLLFGAKSLSFFLCLRRHGSITLVTFFSLEQIYIYKSRGASSSHGVFCIHLFSQVHFFSWAFLVLPFFYKTPMSVYTAGT